MQIKRRNFGASGFLDMGMRLILVNIGFYLCLFYGIANAAQHEKAAFLFNTERQIYASGEKVQFAVIFKNDLRDLGQVLTIELLTLDSRLIKGAKYNLHLPVTYNSFELPPDLDAGNYILCAYASGSGLYITPAMQLISVVYKGNLLPPCIVSSSKTSDSDEIIVKTIKNDERVESPSTLLVQLHNVGMKVEGSLSLARSPAVSTLSFSKTAETKTMVDDPDVNKRGALITGEIMNERTGNPEAFKRVDFSTLANPGMFLSCSTNEKGKFEMYFPFPMSSMEIIISAHTSDSVSITLDNQYRIPKTELTHFENSVVRLDTISDAYENTALEIFKVSQLKAYFTSDIKQIKDSVTMRWFYGEPDYSIEPDNFIQLPTMEDYILELIPGTYSRTEGDKKKIEIVQKNSFYAGYEPLLLIDGVPVYDHKTFLSINVRQISKIELVRSLYRHGEYLFGGIINVISKENNLAGMKLKGNHRVFNVDFLTPDVSCKISKMEKSANVLVDYGYWKPDIVLQEGQFEEIEIAKPFVAGEYVLSFKGLDVMGHIRTATYVLNIDK
ncbi:hypothetical protein [Saccharicrinis sp. FJH54]|uniref:hypothetical protein n=1 Tax=Saccharicrinis sp. FJH54 TaxID=3344665 RepID=UPI0035D3EE8F